MLTLLTIFFLQFTDKFGSERVCLSPTAIEMRERRGISIDELDYEVSPLYLDSIQAMRAQVLHTSRWLNGATVQANDSAIYAIARCGFVDTVFLTKTTSIPFGKPSVSLRKMAVSSSSAPVPPQPSASTEQLTLLNLLPLHQAGYQGKGIRIGIADGGFYHADSLEALPQEQWLGMADFTDIEEDVFGAAGNHGTLCLTAIVGCTSDYTGAATEADYFLFRTEEPATESPKEVDNWVAAIEMADSLGLHIVSTSLGYSTFDNEQFDYTYADMDGRTSRGARAAAIAARKGLLLVVAAGNEGDKPWHYLSTPSDADSILTVGAVDGSGNIASFSSYGPSADGRVKPEVCALGKLTALINPSNSYIIHSNGTSFACPLIAGMAACLWSALPDATNMEIRERIIRSADHYNHPQEQYGYGIPNAWMAYTMPTDVQAPHIHHVSIANKVVKNGNMYLLYNNCQYDVLGNKLE